MPVMRVAIFKKEFQLKPFKNLSSKNLPLMLLLARVLAYAGCFAFVAGLIFLFASMAVLSSLAIVATSATVLLSFAITVLVVSTLLAAIVAFEDNYRIRTEHLVRNSET